MYIIAKTIKGREFMYIKSTAHRITAGDPEKICEILNAYNYKLKAGEIWHSYQIAPYEAEISPAFYQVFRLNRSGTLKEIIK